MDKEFFENRTFPLSVLYLNEDIAPEQFLEFCPDGVIENALSSEAVFVMPTLQPNSFRTASYCDYVAYENGEYSVFNHETLQKVLDRLRPDC